MGFQIEDGTGDGYQAKVTNDNMLVTVATVVSAEHHANHIHGRSYNLLFSQTASGPNDCIVYIKNGDDLDMIIESITVNVPTNEIIEIKLNDAGSPVDGGGITPSNLNAGSNREADGIFQSGNNITGLSGGVSTFKPFFKGGDPSKFFNFDQDIIIPKNRILTLYCVNGSILVNGMLSFYFHEKIL